MKLLMFFKVYAVEIIIVTVGVMAVLYGFSLSRDSCLWRGEWCGQDMDQYLDYSDSIRSGKGFAASRITNVYFVRPSQSPGFIPEIMRLPAYPMLLTLGRLVYDNPRLVLILNYLFYVVMLGYAFMLMRHLMAHWLQPFAFFLIAFYPVLLFYTTQMGNIDMFAGSVLMGFVYHTIRVMQNGSSRLHMVMALLLGVISAFSRQNTLLFVLPFLALSFWQMWRQKQQRGVVRIGVLTLVVLLALGSWMYRNYRITGRPILSAFSGVALFMEHVYFTPLPTPTSHYLNAWFFDQRAAEQYMSTRIAAGDSIPHAYGMLDVMMTKITLEYMMMHPLRTGHHYLVAVKSIFTGRTFVWERADLFNILLRIYHYVSIASLVLFLFFPLALRRSSAHNAMLFQLWLPTFLFVSISAFFHGVVIGNRGIVAVLPLVVVLCLVLFERMLKLVLTLSHKKMGRLRRSVET